MTTPTDDEGRPAGKPETCAECGAAATAGQRYCLRCGSRQAPLPPAIAERLAPLLRKQRGEDVPEAESVVAAAAVGAAATAEDKAEAGEKSGAYALPSPRVAAVAVLMMLGLGVLLGSATSQLAQSAGLTSILLETSPPPPAEEPLGEEDFEAEEPVAETPAVVSEAPVEELLEEPVEEPTSEAPAKAPPPKELFEEPEELLPPVKHVFLIVLGENSYEESFGPTSLAPYLSQTLPAEGELVPNYYGVAGSDLANGVALISGQGPTPETMLNCPTYGEIAPGTVSATGQVEGNGCIYPATAKTLPGQLTEKKLKWKAYVEDIGNGALSGQPATCRHPLPATLDPAHAPLPGDAYETWRNPFVYFHSIVDDPKCAETDVGLDRLAPDLASAKKTPTLSYIVPNACHAGGPVACEAGKPIGPLAAEEFLRTVVPEIQKSPAYKEGGLIAITSSLAPQAGEHPDASSCCGSPVYPNLPPAPEVAPGAGGVKPAGGGGKVGLLLLSPFVKAGTVAETIANHYTLLLTIETLFELEKLGYANEPILLPFDSAVFNYAEEDESTVAPRPGARPRPFSRAKSIAP